MGGEGNFNINGLAVEKPIAEIKVLKPGLGIWRSGINSAFQIAHTGNKFNPSTDHVQSLPKVQLKQSPHGSLEKKPEPSDLRGVSRDELDLMKSFLTGRKQYVEIDGIYYLALLFYCSGNKIILCAVCMLCLRGNHT